MKERIKIISLILAIIGAISTLICIYKSNLISSGITFICYIVSLLVYRRWK